MFLQRMIKPVLRVTLFFNLFTNGERLWIGSFVRRSGGWVINCWAALIVSALRSFLFVNLLICSSSLLLYGAGRLWCFNTTQALGLQLWACWRLEKRSVWLFHCQSLLWNLVRWSADSWHFLVVNNIDWSLLLANNWLSSYQAILCFR